MAINAKKTISTYIFVLLCSYSVLASAIDRKSLYPFSKDSSLFEVNKIVFDGNNSFQDNELFPIITSRTSNLNFVHSLLDYYYVEGNKNSITPKTILIALEKSLKPFQVEYKFLSEEKLKLDSSSIFNYYNQNGFHLTEVDYKVYGDSLSKENIIQYSISENQRFRINQFILIGLDSVKGKSKSSIEKIVKRLEHKYFNENEVIYAINSIYNLLLNSGYFNVRKIEESIIINKEKFTDSVTVVFDTGEIHRFREVKFVDFKGKQHKITDNMKLDLLTWKKGDIYSKSKVDQSVRKLLSLGTFNSVSIDTISIHNNTIDYRVITHYRNQQELNFEPGFNQTQNQFYNVFLQGSYSHKNVFGEAQAFNTNLSLLNRDFEEYIKTPRQGFLNHLDDLIDEIAFNLSISDPYWFTIDDASFGTNAEFNFSYRRIDNYFDLETYRIPLTIPVTFKTNLDITALSFGVVFERQKPKGFDQFIEKGDELDDFERVFQSLVLYSDLNNYFKNSNPFLSSIQILGRAIRDKRNNPFMPTNGHLINLEGEWAVGGLTNYNRILTNMAYFTNISKKEVAAFKLKFGGTHFWEEGNRYISLDKQYFSGGANSVRGWASRKLRYTTSSIKDLDATSRRLLENFVGSSVVLEGAVEYRLNFGMPEVNLGALSEHIASMGLTLFGDFGNSYGWLLGEDDFNVGEVFSKLAYSAGMGLTYETPVGPIRLDFALPIYGPINYEYQSIFKAKDALSNLNWHVGLGYSF